MQLSTIESERIGCNVENGGDFIKFNCVLHSPPCRGFSLLDGRWRMPWWSYNNTAACGFDPSFIVNPHQIYTPPCCCNIRHGILQSHNSRGTVMYTTNRRSSHYVSNLPTDEQCVAAITIGCGACGPCLILFLGLERSHLPTTYFDCLRNKLNKWSRFLGE